MSDLCGSYRGYQRHQRRKEKPCDPCMAAKAKYAKNYRATHKEAIKRQETAKRHALLALAARHPEEYRKIYRYELAKNEDE